MKLNFNKKLIGSILIVVLLLLTISGATSYYISENALSYLGHQFIENMVEELHDTIEMQHTITQEKLNADIGVMEMEIATKGRLYLDPTDMREELITNQNTKQQEKVSIPTLSLGDGISGLTMNSDNDLVDRVQKVIGGTATIFQVLPNKLLRVATNVRKNDGTRALGTYIPSSSPVYQAVMRGETYRGKAFVVNDWFVTEYKPVRDSQGKIVAVIYVGRKMMAPQLRKSIEKKKYGDQGYAIVALSNGKLAYHPDQNLQANGNLRDFSFGAELINNDDGFITYEYNGEKKLAYTKLFKERDWHLIFTLPKGQLSLGTDNTLKVSTVGVMLGGIILSVLIFIFLLKALLKPLTELATITQKISEGDLDARSDYNADDAIGHTVNSVNTMVAELKNKLGFSDGVLQGLNIPCGIVGPDFTMLWANQQVCDLLEKKSAPESFVGVPSGAFYWNDPSRETLSDRAIKENQALHVETTWVGPSGVEKHIDVNTTPFWDMDGNLLGSISIWIDLTEIRNQQVIVQQQNERIAQAADQATLISENLSSAAEELSAQIDEASQGSQVQREQATSTATAMEEMNATVLEVAQNASAAAHDATNAKGKAQDGASVVSEVIAAIGEVQTKAITLKDSMEALGKQAQGINAVMNVISDIADQTNLLALNAAIEAARAGEAGRGFAVVADEVRKLAEKTMQATQEVDDAISNMQRSTTNNINATEEAAASVVKSTELAKNSGQTLSEIVQLVDTVEDQVRSIATAAEQQSATSEEINKATEQINQIAGESADLMEQSSQAIQEVAQMAGQLNGVIDGMSSSNKE